MPHLSADGFPQVNDNPPPEGAADFIWPIACKRAEAETGIKGKK